MEKIKRKKREAVIPDREPSILMLMEGMDYERVLERDSGGIYSCWRMATGVFYIDKVR